MLPFEIIKGAKKSPILIELKNGDSVKGNLENVDNFMNMKLKDIIYTSSDGEKFWKTSEGFIRGNNINSIQFKEGLIDKIEEEKEKLMNIPEVITTSKNIVTTNPHSHRGGSNFRGRGAPPTRGRGHPHRGRGKY